MAVLVKQALSISELAGCGSDMRKAAISLIAVESMAAHGVVGHVDPRHGGHAIKL